MASDPPQTGENLRQNVRLVAETMQQTSKIAANDTESNKPTIKPDLWQSVVNLSDHLCKQQTKNVTDLNSSNVISTADKRYSKSSVIEIKLTTPSAKQNERDSHNFDNTGDCISELIGHIGLWQLVWVVFLIMFQVPAAFHLFSFMFQVSFCVFWWDFGWVALVGDSDEWF